MRATPLSCAAALLLAGCAGRTPPDPRAVPAPLALEPCTLPGAASPARCGTLRVPEDRARPAGRAIGLNVAVVPGQAPARRDPVFLLAGGPGQAATALGPFLDELHGLHPDRDLVLLDQRGTGGSNPLTCGSPDLLQDARAGRSLIPGPAGARACARRLSARADVRFYGTAEAVEDLDAVRAALGYDRVNLIGISYGTRVAQAYLRAHPGQVRAVALRAVAPLGFNIPLDGALATQAALDGVVADCAADARCARAYPGLRAELDALLAGAGTGAAEIVLAVPGRGDPVAVPLSRDIVAGVLNLSLLGPTQRMIPALVHRASAEGPQALAPLVGSVLAAAYGTLPIGVYLSVVCTEDVPRIGEADAGRARSTFLPVDAIVAACREWPRRALPADFHRPVASDVPVLLISGEADPATPPEAAEGMLRHLTNARHLVVPAASHGPPFPGCVGDVVARFLASASVDGLGEACVAHARWPDFAGT